MCSKGSVNTRGEIADSAHCKTWYGTSPFRVLRIYSHLDSPITVNIVWKESVKNLTKKTCSTLYLLHKWTSNNLVDTMEHLANTQSYLPSGAGRNITRKTKNKNKTHSLNS